MEMVAVPKLLRSSEVADLLGISRAQVWNLQARGELRVTRIGRSVRFAADDLRDFINARRGGDA